MIDVLIGIGERGADALLVARCGGGLQACACRGRSIRARTRRRGAGDAEPRKAGSAFGSSRPTRCVGRESEAIPPSRARSARCVAPFASQSEVARASSAAASAPRPAARSAAASASRASAWTSSASVAAASSTAACASSIAAAMLAAPRERLRAHAAPGDRRLEVVAGERLALVRERFGFAGAILREQRAARAAPPACAASLPSPSARMPS
jgi:pyruvate/2-oxoglutarate dehydrogenase complex dihydrolipoamide acyltransferase (E2) component